MPHCGMRHPRTGLPLVDGEIHLEISDLKPEILALYRYFAYAAHMRKLCADHINPEWLQELSEDAYGVVRLLFSPPGIYLLYSYSSIYLVIEGYQSLRLNDPEIDHLLASPFVDRLRLFRNASFHFQKDPLSRKQLQFFGTEEERTEDWLNALYRAFERFFRENTLPIPKQIRESLRDKSHVEIARAMKDYWIKPD